MSEEYSIKIEVKNSEHHRHIIEWALETCNPIPRFEDLTSFPNMTDHRFIELHFANKASAALFKLTV